MSAAIGGEVSSKMRDICDGDISAIKCMNSSVSNSSTIKAKSAGLTQDISSN